MGLFDIFKKKGCAICGKEVGVFGRKKLEDGEICTDCVKKLSPFFDDRRHSTVAQIEAQLEYRAENEKALAGFNHSVAIGKYEKMFIEVVGGIPTRFVISSSDNYKTKNPDIISFKNVSSCTPDIKENRTEEKYTNDKGERVSYNPPRYEYSYDFNIKLNISGCEYFDFINLDLNSGSVELKTVAPAGNGFFNMRNTFDPMLYPEYREFKAMVDEICAYVSAGQKGVPYNGMQYGQTNNFAQGGAADPIQGILAQMRTANDMQTLTGLQMNLTTMIMNHPNKAAIMDQAATIMADSMVRIECATAGIPYNGAMGNAGNSVSGSPAVQNASTSSNVSWVCPACGSENVGKFCNSCGEKMPVTKVDASWTCLCGAKNTAKFCSECGLEKASPEDIECSECSWTAEPGASTVPTFCPNCGRRFDYNDLK